MTYFNLEFHLIVTTTPTFPSLWLLITSLRGPSCGSCSGQPFLPVSWSAAVYTFVSVASKFYIISLITKFYTCPLVIWNVIGLKLLKIDLLFIIKLCQVRHVNNKVEGIQTNCYS